jgi:hypothetical protein
MNCCVRRQVEVGGSYEPLGVAGLILIDRNILDLGPMLQKDLHRDNLPEVSAPNVSSLAIAAKKIAEMAEWLRALVRASRSLLEATSIRLSSGNGRV